MAQNTMQMSIAGHSALVTTIFIAGEEIVDTAYFPMTNFPGYTITRVGFAADGETSVYLVPSAYKGVEPTPVNGLFMAADLAVAACLKGWDLGFMPA